MPLCAGQHARMTTRIFSLLNRVQHYAWGTRDAIPALLGIENDDARPCAELWMGAHESAPSTIDDGEGQIPLDRAIALDPTRFLGAHVVETWGARLPFLFKVLSAAEPLSIQCHPDSGQAEAGFAREEAAGIARASSSRNYKDPRAKPELLVALSPFIALKGFRAPADIARLLRRSAPGALDALADRVRENSVDEGLRAVLSFALETVGEDRARILRALDDGVRDRPTPEAALVRQLRALHPDDMTVLCPLFLNLIVLKPGEGVFLGPGELHAYVEGTGLELMASSDNVLRGGLTPKHVDKSELLRIARFVVDDGVRHRGDERALAPFTLYDTPAREVRLLVGSVDGEASLPVSTPCITLALEGALTLVDESDPRTSLPLAHGASAFVCADTRVRVSGTGRLAIATVRVDDA
jgi:mannose-6-phosphate isomerase